MVFFYFARPLWKKVPIIIILSHDTYIDIFRRHKQQNLFLLQKFNFNKLKVSDCSKDSNS